MTAATVQLVDTPLRVRLLALAWQRDNLRRLTRLLAVAWAWEVALLAVVLFDAIWPLGDWARLVAGLALTACLAWALWRLRWRRVEERRAVLTEARRVERWFALSTNPLVNALWLEPVADPARGLSPLSSSSTGAGTDPLSWRGDSGPSPGSAGASPSLHTGASGGSAGASPSRASPSRASPSLAASALEACLARRAVEQGSATLLTTDVSATLDRASLRRHVRLAGLVACAWAALWLVQGHLVTGGVARVFDPLGDHPPFSRTRFVVSLEPARPQTGDDVVVTAALSGRVPAGAELVEVGPDGTPLARWPMRAMAERRGVFQRTLGALREPVTVRVEAGEGRSRRLRIVPAPRPAPAGRQGPLPPSPNPPATSPDVEDGSDTATPERMVLGEMGQLADLIRRLQALAEQMQARVDAGDAQPMSPGMRQELESLLRRLEQLGGRSRALAQMLGQMKGTPGAAQPERLMAALARVARQLGGLELPDLAGAAPLPQRGGARGSRAEAHEWLMKLAGASGRDLSKVEDMIANLDKALGGVTTLGAAAPGVPQTQAGAGGNVGENTATNGTATDPTQALIQQIPPAYRDLAGRYFRRLAEDQSRRN